MHSKVMVYELIKVRASYRQMPFFSSHWIYEVTLLLLLYLIHSRKVHYQEAIEFIKKKKGNYIQKSRTEKGTI